ncbi:MAG: putative RNA-binding Zn-ribbon protein involved in translation (DUF1610 family) [Parasphingorhabdus sp.]|jgi:predicted RNA-binding Zn-ribbon protein involved in translation (DUF1610 family)
MQKNSSGIILWWVALILAVATYILFTLSIDFLQLQSENSFWFPAELGSKLQLLDIAGILKLALSVFFIVLAILGLFRTVPRAPDRTGNLQGAGGPSPVGGHVPHLSAGARQTITSEAADLSYGFLRSMEWRRFEIVCAEYLRCMGYEVMETGFGKKDDVSIELYLPGKSEVFNVVQCKAWPHQMDVQYVRKFAETMKRRGISEGMIFNVRGFTAKAVKHANRSRIALVDGETLCSRIRAMEIEKSNALTEIASEGDYSTPTCPDCGIKMVLRRKKKRSDQDEFWGCINFPRCSITYPF